MTTEAEPAAGVDGAEPKGLAALHMKWRGFWTDAHRDVVRDPKIGPVAGWVILALIGLVTALAAKFSENAVRPDPHCLVFVGPDGSRSAPECPERAFIPPVPWGFLTIFAVSILALIMGWEPIVRREWTRARVILATIALTVIAVAAAVGTWLLWPMIEPAIASMAWLTWLAADWARPSVLAASAILGPAAAMGLFVVLRGIIGGLARWFARWPKRARQVAVGFTVKAPSHFLSFFDWAFVRVFAVAAGTTRPTLRGRYLVLAAWLIGAGALAFPDWPEMLQPLGWTGVIAGCLIIFGVVRRWLWIEEDRVQFIVRRGRKLAQVQRIGFAQDLRDEALTVMIALFVFIPLGLRQAELQLDWFDFDDAGQPSLITWIGFFGAELAKAVPLVDWSEVFGVENGSPLEPREGEPWGATAVFALRATLDILLIASVLQAFQIAAQLSEQIRGFYARAVDILDPFEERRVFDRFGKVTPVSSLLTSAQMPRVVEQSPDRDRGDPDGWSGYSLTRLRSIAMGASGELDAIQKDEDAMRFALATLAARETAPVAARLRTDRDDPASQAFMAMLLAEAAGDEGARSALTDWAQRAMLPAEDWRDRRMALPAARGVLAAAQADGAALRDAVANWARSVPADTDREALMTIAFGVKTALAAAEPATAHARAIALFEASLRPAAKAAMETGLPENPGAFALVEKGKSFKMGSPEDEEGRYDYEGPQREVLFGHSFAMARFAVTFDEYDLFCAATGARRPSDAGWGRGRRPVINVSWDDICDAKTGYLAWLNDTLGLTGRADAYRLPSEAEWEYACRAQRSLEEPPTRYWFGDDAAALGEHAWFSRNSGDQTHPVGEKPANPFGLYDMHGNVWEWCADRWHESYDGADRPDDGRAWVSGNDNRRVVRGGSWFNGPQALRSACRGDRGPAARSLDLGFRLARTILR